MTCMRNPTRLLELDAPLSRHDADNARVTMTGETASTPGLAIVPALGRLIENQWHFTGAWAIRHATSGLIVPLWGNQGLGLGHARDAVALLGQLRIDWTQPRETVLGAYRNDYDSFNQINALLHEAVEGQRPARMCSSWEQLPRHWFLYLTHVDDVVEALFDSRAAAEEQLRYLDSIGESQGCVIRQEDSEPWALRCASTDCRDPLSEDERVSHPDPAGVTDVASAEGWRRIDEQHWLCPPCSYLFTAAREF